MEEKSEGVYESFKARIQSSEGYVREETRERENALDDDLTSSGLPVVTCIELRKMNGNQSVLMTIRCSVNGCHPND